MEYHQIGWSTAVLGLSRVSAIECCCSLAGLPLARTNPRMDEGRRTKNVLSFYMFDDRIPNHSQFVQITTYKIKTPGFNMEHRTARPEREMGPLFQFGIVWNFTKIESTHEKYFQSF